MKNLFFTLLIAGAFSSNAQNRNYQIPAGDDGSIGRYNTLIGAKSPWSSVTSPENWSQLSYDATLGYCTYNTGYGHRAMRFLTTGRENTSVGAASMDNITIGDRNVSFGRKAMISFTKGMGNVALGVDALYDYQGDPSYSQAENYDSQVMGKNTAVGMDSGRNLIQGGYNLFLGHSAGPNTVAPYNGYFSNKLYINHRTDDNPLIFGDFGDPSTAVTNAFRYIKFNVHTNQGSRVEINANWTASFPGAGKGNSGLRFTNLNSSHATDKNNGKVLTVNNLGDVILVDDDNGPSTCTTPMRIPVVNSTSGSMICSQIYDNSTTTPIGDASVGINTPGPYSFTAPVGAGYATFNGPSGAPMPGNFRLDVRGVERAVSLFLTSDKKYKKDINPIEGALEIVTALNGKTYHWDTEKNKDMGFDGTAHAGFIAQEIEKAIPHIVATDSDGNKSVNYIEIIPYLVEALKEQQAQIEDLKIQIAENFKAQNAELIGLANTKIISVSPNPSKDVITVSFNVDKSITDAKLFIHDINGKLLSSLNVKERDNNINKTFQKDNFGAGVYIVSLVVNGKSVDSKKIVFN